MHDIALIPGAAHNASSMWPLQAKDDSFLHPIDYERGNFHRRATRMPFLLQQYAVRIFQKLKALDRPVDLYAWSMAAPTSLHVAKLANKETPGLVRNIVMITPGVFHGAPHRNFHRSPTYAYSLIFPPLKKTLRRATAVREIQQQIPDFDPEVPEDSAAMIESGDGVIRIPQGFDRKRLSLYYTPDDEVIPEDVTLHMAKRARIIPTAVQGYGHELPLLDTDGSVLQYIRSQN